jgi:hypothetical protein
LEKGGERKGKRGGVFFWTGRERAWLGVGVGVGVGGEREQRDGVVRGADACVRFLLLASGCGRKGRLGRSRQGPRDRGGGGAAASQPAARQRRAEASAGMGWVLALGAGGNGRAGAPRRAARVFSAGSGRRAGTG